MAKIEVNASSYEVHREEFNLVLNKKNTPYDIISLPGGDYHLTVENKSYTVRIVSKDAATGKLTLSINGRTIETRLQNKLAELLKRMGMEGGKRKLKDLKAPMPGLVLDVLVQAGQEIEEGQELMVLEAMKMENAIKSPQAGTIASVHVTKLDKVDKNQLLIVFA